ncbi:putative integral membrane protein [Phyllobacterium sp. YR531]|nr:putative integral membrane protein [Phyllobacterium sp. YR531]
MIDSECGWSYLIKFAGLKRGLHHLILRNLTVTFALAATYTMLAPVAPALAAFTVCNQTSDIANVAIGEQIEGEMRTEGWWAIAANRCADVIKVKLTNRYIYVHAVDVQGRPVLKGSVTLCVDTKKFQIIGKDTCWQRNHLRGLFTEVDTQSSDNWTLFLKDGS